MIRWRNITTMAIDLFNDLDLDRWDLSNFKGIGGSGAAMPAAVYDRLRALTGLSYTESYGMTEVMGPTHINPPEQPRRACLGQPIF